MVITYFEDIAASVFCYFTKKTLSQTSPFIPLGLPFSVYGTLFDTPFTTIYTL
jgi:hypothetical protein